jgi:hypothetical protein
VQLSASGTKYKAVISTVGAIQQTTTEATLTVLPDTFPPVPTVAALKTAAGDFEVSVTWDELVKDDEAGNQANFTVSPGTIASFKYWPYDQGTVLHLSGVTAGQTITVSVNNVSDLKGNKITTAGRQDRQAGEPALLDRHRRGSLQRRKSHRPVQRWGGRAQHEGLRSDQRRASILG